MMLKNGYLEVYTPRHPNATKQGYVLQHRLIMEQYLERLLLLTEIVHHKNGNRQDNRIENLQILSSKKEHALVHYPVDFWSNPDYRKQYWKDYKAKNLVKIRTQSLRYYHAHKERYMKNQRKRRLRLKIGRLEKQ